MNLKKKYLRKKRDLKEANRSGTSCSALAKAEKAFKQYEFLIWLDEFVQLREGRSKLKVEVDKNNGKTSKIQEKLREDDERENDLSEQSEGESEQGDEDASMEYNELLMVEENQDKSFEVEEQTLQVEPPKKKSFQKETQASVKKNINTPNLASKKENKIKKSIQGTARETLLEELELSLISKISTRSREREKKNNNKKSQLDNEDAFCHALAMDLKQLPYFERCMAKNELRNVIYKHQMASMERNMQPYQNQHFNVGQNLSPNKFSSPPRTPVHPSSENS